MVLESYVDSQVEEGVFNYVLGSAQGMYKFWRHLLSLGVKNPTEKALNYALGIVLSSDIDPRVASGMFKDYASLVYALAEALESLGGRRAR